MTVKNCSTPIQVTVAQVCSIGSGARNYLPLLVDEGYTKYAEDTDVLAALSAHPNISLAK